MFLYFVEQEYDDDEEAFQFVKDTYNQLKYIKEGKWIGFGGNAYSFELHLDHQICFSFVGRQYRCQFQEFMNHYKKTMDSTRKYEQK
jgi:hypothetical protein